MIARLSGTLAEVTADSAVIDVGGVGYQVLASARTLEALGGTGSQVMVLTELQVREDAWTLFAFGSAGERHAFRALTSIQGVGGRLALAILSVLPPDELARAAANGDKALISRANGVGPKLAARIANELQGKLGAPALAGVAGAPPPRAEHRRRRPLRPRQPRLQARRRQRRRQRRRGRSRLRRDARRAGQAGAEKGGEVIAHADASLAAAGDHVLRLLA